MSSPSKRWRCQSKRLSRREETGKGTGTYADPWVFEGLLRGDPLGWVDGQHLVDQVLGLRGHRVPLGGWKLQEVGGGGRQTGMRTEANRKIQ